LHRPAQEAKLLREAGTRVAQEQMQSDAQEQREGNIPVLHLRERAARFLA
jgi:hypothetical protein